MKVRLCSFGLGFSCGLCVISLIMIINNMEIINNNNKFHKSDYK